MCVGGECLCGGEFVCVCEGEFVYMVSMGVCVHACVHACMHVCLSVCMCTCICKTYKMGYFDVNNIQTTE